MARRNAPAAGAPRGGARVLYPIHEGPQLAFMESDAEELLYGGAAFGGKSYALRAFLVSYCLTYPGAQVVLFRRTFRELEDTHIIKLQAEIPSYLAQYKASTHDFQFENGSLLMLRFCEKEDDVRTYDTFEADAMGFDEVTAFSEFQYKYLITRCRSVKSWWPGRRIRAATNPGNVGHGWVKKRFIDFCKPYEITTAPVEEGGLRRQFIPALAEDNHTGMKRDPNYVNLLKGLPWEEYRAKALGDWDVFAGQFFQRYRKVVHECTPFTPPPEWSRYISVDWGTASPHAVYWGARPPGTNHVWLYREQYGAGVSTREQARRAALSTKASEEKIDIIVTDPAMWAREKNSEGELMHSVADVWKEEFSGIADVVRGNNERILGASLFRECLDWQGVENSEGVTVLVPPRLHLMEGRCPNFVRTVPNLVHSSTNVEDVDTSQEDHAYDSVRYMLRYLFDAPIRPKQQRYYDTPTGLISLQSV